MSRSMVLSSFVAGGIAAPRRPESIGTGFRQALCKLGFPYTTASMKSLIWEIGGERTSEIITMAWSSNSAMENEGTRRDDAVVRTSQSIYANNPTSPVVFTGENKTATVR